MACTTGLLITCDSSLIEAVRSVFAPIDNLRLEVVPGIDQAVPYLKRDNVGLGLIDLAGIGVADVGQLLREISIARSPFATVVISERYCPNEVLELLRLGVFDCLSRPLDLGRFAFLVEMLTVRARYAGLLNATKPKPAQVQSFDDRDPFLYSSAEMARIMEQIRMVAGGDATILLSGETGTGKTRLARVIHDLSKRRDGPFLVVHCGSFSSSLIESEMFGHVKGAFTGADRDRVGKFAEVSRGTLLLDDIDSLPLELQIKLLRVVEERTFERVGSNSSQPLEARLIAATNKSLHEEVAAGRFRADLYYRINVIEIHIPLLREHRSDIQPIADKYLREFSARLDAKVQGMTPEALRALEMFEWPGNIRELRNVIEQAIALCPGPLVRLEDLPKRVRPASCEFYPPSGKTSRPSSLAQSKIEAETALIRETLRRNGNNRLRTARELGISRVGLYKKLRKYGLTVKA